MTIETGYCGCATIKWAFRENISQTTNLVLRKAKWFSIDSIRHAARFDLRRFIIIQYPKKMREECTRQKIRYSLFTQLTIGRMKSTIKKYEFRRDKREEKEFRRLISFRGMSSRIFWCKNGVLRTIDDWMHCRVRVRPSGRLRSCSSGGREWRGKRWTFTNASNSEIGRLRSSASAVSSALLLTAANSITADQRWRMSMPGDCRCLRLLDSERIRPKDEHDKNEDRVRENASRKDR